MTLYICYFITNNVNQTVLECQNHPPATVYQIVRLYGVIFKVLYNEKLINKSIYLRVVQKQSILRFLVCVWSRKP